MSYIRPCFPPSSTWMLHACAFRPTGQANSSCSSHCAFVASFDYANARLALSSPALRAIRSIVRWTNLRPIVESSEPRWCAVCLLTECVFLAVREENEMNWNEMDMSVENNILMDFLFLSNTRSKQKYVCTMFHYRCRAIVPTLKRTELLRVIQMFYF